MELEQAFDRVDREALWSVLKIYGLGRHLIKGNSSSSIWHRVAQRHGYCRQLLNGIQALYREANACVRVGGEFSESFAVEVGVRHGCVVSPWLFNSIFMDGCMREMKSKVVNAGAKLRLNGEVTYTCNLTQPTLTYHNPCQPSPKSMC